MGTIRQTEPVALVAGILYAGQEPVVRAMSILTDRYGPLEMASEPFAFSLTDYYEKEMGRSLDKFFCCFQQPVNPDELPSIKLATNDIERELAGEGITPPKRRVNIDPGYVTPAKLVLASTKDYSHRVYLGCGIYGEVTLRCAGGILMPLDTTYPDYA
ncbi:DUF4416 family protein, partial [Candidatus Latescibacterota bacterium]